MGLIAAGIVILLAGQMPGSFTVSVAGDRRSFRIGESIHLVLTYNDVPNRRDADGPCTHHATPVLVRTSGTGDARRDRFRVGLGLPGGICGCVEGGVIDMPRYVPVVEFDANGVPSITNKLVPPEPRPQPKRPAVKVPYELTDYVRFHAPGRYRLYLSDQNHGTELISNVIQIVITPRDRNWEGEQLRWATRVLDSSTTSAERSAAIKTLEMLPSRQALDEMARRHVDAGLFAARDRGAAIAALTTYVEDPASAVTDHTLRVLAGLHATRSTQGPLSTDVKYTALMNAHGRRLRALASAGVLVERLTAAFEADVLAESAVAPQDIGRVRLTHALAGFARDVEAALNRLAPATRDAVLASRRVMFADARFAPMLERLARGGSQAAIPPLHDVAPGSARPIILRDLAAPRPRLPIAIAGLLGDATLPALDAVFLRQLEAARDPQDITAAMDRIERYGTPADAARVRRAYEARVDRHVCSIAIPALAFFFRVDPAFAAAEFDAVRRSSGLDESCPGDWRVNLAGTIAQRRLSSGLEKFAATLISGDDAEAAVSAAEMLSEYGSPAAKAAIQRGLSSWQGRWSAEQVRALEAADPSTWESVLEERLLSALEWATRWQLDAGDYGALASGCRSVACRRSVSGARERAAEAAKYPSVVRDPDSLRGVAARYRVRFAEVPLAELEEQLRFSPPGTVFHTSQGGSLDELWDVDLFADQRRLEQVVRRAGMSLFRK